MGARVRRVLVLLLLLLACNRRGPTAVANPQALLQSVISNAAGDAEVSALAARRARLLETRELAVEIQRTASAARDEFARVAQRRNVAVPKALDEKKIALRDNLMILPGQVLDRAYALAMSQDMKTLLHNLDAIGSDSDLRQVAGKYRSAIEDHQRAADRLLSRLGGSPWPAAP